MEAQVQSRPTWDEYFMHLAEESALRSKDPHTKVGACIVKNKKVLSLGYNGAPRNFPDDMVPECRDLDAPLIEQKYTYMVHAELNAVLNSGCSLTDLVGSTIYVTISPCHECAKVLAQLGIEEVVYKDEYHKTDIWDVSKKILSSCGVKFRKLRY